MRVNGRSGPLPHLRCGWGLNESAQIIHRDARQVGMSGVDRLPSILPASFHQRFGAKNKRSGMHFLKNPVFRPVFDKHTRAFEELSANLLKDLTTAFEQHREVLGPEPQPKTRRPYDDVEYDDEPDGQLEPIYEEPPQARAPRAPRRQMLARRTPRASVAHEEEEEDEQPSSGSFAVATKRPLVRRKEAQS